jgi:hypothetical protein
MDMAAWCASGGVCICAGAILIIEKNGFFKGSKKNKGFLVSYPCSNIYTCV